MMLHFFTSHACAFAKYSFHSIKEMASMRYFLCCQSWRGIIILGEMNYLLMTSLFIGFVTGTKRSIEVNAVLALFLHDLA